MSEELEAQPDTKKKVNFDLDYKESIVDIYVSTESLRVHDRPWVERTSPTSTGHTDSPPAVSFAGESTRKKSPVQACLRSEFLAVICLMLTIWIIVLTVQAHVDRNNWEKVSNCLSNLTNDCTSCKKMKSHLTC